MRRLCLILLVGLVAVPAALAARGATGDGALELRDVYGNVSLSGEGVLWGQMDKGALIVTDPVTTDGDVSVTGADKPPKTLPDGSVLYVGRAMTFRITGGTYKLQFNNGNGIDLTTVGVGKATILPSLTVVDDGDYALDGGKWKSVPLLDPLTVKFGTPKPPPTTTTTGP
ncbi:MAG TPA: hypothetical protein VLV46_06445 [Gaiellaceae bacterium]|nr:hypothetical protein [Gaiellaceae bacterium]